MGEYMRWGNAVDQSATLVRWEENIDYACRLSSWICRYIDDEALVS